MMTLNLGTLNVRGLRDSSKCACLFAELKNLRLYVSAVQETHFICAANCRVLESDFNVFSAYGSHCSAGVSLLVGRSLDADVDVFVGDRGRLVVADVAVKSFKFCCGECFLFSSVGTVPGRFEALFLMGDWMRSLIPR